MAIEVKHGISAAAAATAAFGGGQGKSRARAALGGAAASTRLENAANARAFQAQKIEGDRAFHVAQGDRRHEQGLERQTFNDGLQQAAQKRTELRLSRKQEKDLEELANNEANALSSTDFTEDEKSELRRRFAARRAGIKPVERLRKPTQAEQFKNNTFTDEGGRIYALENGKPSSLLFDPTNKEQQQAASAKEEVARRQKATEFAIKNSINEETGAVDDAVFRANMKRMGFDTVDDNPLAQSGSSTAAGNPLGDPSAPARRASADEAGSLEALPTWLREVDAPQGAEKEVMARHVTVVKQKRKQLKGILGRITTNGKIDKRKLAWAKQQKDWNEQEFIFLMRDLKSGRLGAGKRAFDQANADLGITVAQKGDGFSREQIEAQERLIEAENRGAVAAPAVAQQPAAVAQPESVAPEERSASGDRFADEVTNSLGTPSGDLGVGAPDVSLGDAPPRSSMSREPHRKGQKKHAEILRKQRIGALKMIEDAKKHKARKKARLSLFSDNDARRSAR